MCQLQQDMKLLHQTHYFEITDVTENIQYIKQKLTSLLKNNSHINTTCPIQCHELHMSLSSGEK